MKSERALLLSLAVLLAAPMAVAAQDDVPRRADGKPDLSGAYDVATLTPLTRPREFGDRLTLTDEEAAAIARRKAEIYEADFKPSDPNREAPPVGGAPIFDPGLEVASGGSGGYNAFYMDPGDNVIRIDGKWRTSIITDPPNGQYPEMTPAGMARAAAQFAAFGHKNTGTAWWLEENEDRSGPYDNMEQRPLPERCLLGFSSTGGPPMLPALYNNHKRIVQTGNHVMILIEMVHDARVVRIGGEHAPAAERRWMGDSIGWWEGDTLVVDTTNFGEEPALGSATKDLHVVERFQRLADGNLLYGFTVEDPNVWETAWSGEYVWRSTPNKVFEYACHEGNYALGNVMRGARLLEADAIAAAGGGE